MQLIQYQQNIHVVIPDLKQNIISCYAAGISV